MGRQKIVLGFDGSAGSNAALDVAIELAGSFACDLALVHVIDWSPYEFRTWDENEFQARVKREQIRSDRESLFPAALEKAAAAGLSAEATVRYGHPAGLLAEIARHEKARCIVIGKRGKSKLRHMVVGGVASAVVQEASCPVMVVPAPDGRQQ